MKLDEVLKKFIGWAAESKDSSEKGVQFYDCDPEQDIPRNGQWEVTMRKI